MRNFSVIILSAGVGKRLMPLSEKYHKSLIPITGRPNLLRTMDIVGKYAKKIIIMTNENSYGDHFDVVKKSQYRTKTTVKINPEAFTTNTVTSFLRGLNELTSKDLRKGVLIVEGDQLYKADELIRMIRKWNHRKSAYFTQDRENEWAVLDNGSKKRKVVTVHAGSTGMCMAGVAFLSKKDALSTERAFYDTDTLHKSLYYESVVEFCRTNGIFDVYNHYSPSPYSREYDNLGDLYDILGQTEFLKLFDRVRRTDSMTNNTFKVTLSKDSEYILKIPGAGTDMFIDRQREEAISKEFSDYNVAPRSYKSGYITIVEYIKHGRILKPTVEDMIRAAKIISRVHKIPTPPELDCKALVAHSHCINWYEEIQKYIDTIDKYNPKYRQMLESNEHYKSLNKYVMDIIYTRSPLKKVYCQIDLVPNNIIITKGRAKVIDHEYAGITNRYWDLGSFLTEMFIFYPLRMNWDLANVFIHQYAKSSKISIDFEEVKRWMTVVDFIWGVWGYAKTAAGQDFLAYGNSRLLTAYQRSSDDRKKRGEQS